MKAIILARGLGTRMRKTDPAAHLDPAAAAAADVGLKALIPIGRPFLDYVLHTLAEAACTNVCLIIGPEHTQLRDYYSALQTRRLNIHFAIQEQPRGTADAVRAAQPFTGPDPFLMLNSDNYYPVRLRALADLSSAGVAVFEREAMIRESNIPPERIAKFAVVRTSHEGFLRRIIEKPDEATLAAMGPHVFVSMNCWRFSPLIYAACKAIKPSPRGEYEVTDAVQYAIDHLGESFHVSRLHAGVLDLSSRADIEPVRQRLAGSAVSL